MENLKIYEKVRQVPETAKKKIEAGRLKGKTDINPMWRIKTLTEEFGPCGFGWYAEIVKRWLEPGAGETVAAFTEINLYVKAEGEWSKPIPGTGGSMFIAKEQGGLHTSDEAFKMSYTDALSVACKALGIGADVYWNEDTAKYKHSESPSSKTERKSAGKIETQLRSLCEEEGVDFKSVTDFLKEKKIRDIEALNKAQIDYLEQLICSTCNAPEREADR